MPAFAIRHSAFGIRHSAFGIRHSLVLNLGRVGRCAREVGEQRALCAYW
jgi:hypothetical protein